MPSKRLLNRACVWGADVIDRLIEGFFGSVENTPTIWYDNKTQPNERVMIMAGEFSRRVSFTVSEELEEAMRESAWRNRQNVSEWLREAISAKLQLEELRAKKS